MNHEEVAKKIFNSIHEPMWRLMCKADQKDMFNYAKARSIDSILLVIENTENKEDFEKVKKIIEGYGI